MLNIDLLSGVTVDEQVFHGDRPEVRLMTADSEEEKSMLFSQTRQFLKQRGLQIGDSEPISLQVLCRDPHPNHHQPLSFIFIRKACSFAVPLKITSVFVI